MGFEIEIKAHVAPERVEDIREFLSSYPGSENLGTTDKCDIYWANSENDPPRFRTRLEKTDKGAAVLFTSKPLKKKDYLTEYNVENEFTSSADQWEKVLEFVRGLGLTVCRRKWKKGYNFTLPCNGFSVHAELLEVRFLGWFLEMEICSEKEEDIDKTEAEKTLFAVLDASGLERSLVEKTGYNKMLVAAGHERG